MIPMEDVGAGLHAVIAGAAQSEATSGTAPSTSTGDIIDRNALPADYQSGCLVYGGPAVLTSGFGITFRAKVSTRNATAGVGSTWAKLATGAVTVTKVGSTATFNGRITGKLDFNLRPAGRYLKVNQSPAFTGTASDRAQATVGQPVLIFGGSNRNRADGLTEAAPVRTL